MAMAIENMGAMAMAIKKGWLWPWPSAHVQRAIFLIHLFTKVSIEETKLSIEDVLINFFGNFYLLLDFAGKDLMKLLASFTGSCGLMNWVKLGLSRISKGI